MPKHSVFVSSAEKDHEIKSNPLFKFAMTNACALALMNYDGIIPSCTHRIVRNKNNPAVSMETDCALKKKIIF